MKAQQKVTVIANCHTAPISQILAFCCRDINIDGIPIDAWYNPDSDVRTRAASIINEASKTDIIFTFNIGETFEQIATNSLRCAYIGKLRTFTNIRFDGLHPDITYFGNFGGRWSNFLSDYHSKIVLYSFASGRNADQCISLFHGDIYHKLAYYDVFEKSANELCQRDADCDVKFADEFLSTIKEKYCLLTINHPTSVIFHRLCRALCKNMDIRFIELDETIYPNPLVQDVILPIYNEIAEQLKLPYRTPQYFVRPPFGYITSPSGRTFSIPEYVKLSYQFYEKNFSQEEFNNAVKNMNFYDNFRNKID